MLAAVFSVTNLDDGLVTDFGDQPGTLRQAIFDANETPGHDFIEFDDTSLANGGTITLTHGQLTISESVIIDASMLPNGLTIDGNDPSSQLGNGIRLFNIVDVTSGADPPEVTFIGPAIGLTLKGGKKIRGHSTFCFNDFVTIAS